MTYTEKSRQLTLDASVAVFVLTNEQCDDLELLPLQPVRMTDAEIAELSTRWPGRGLIARGVIGLVGASPACAFKEALEPEQTSALANAFLRYLQVLFSGSFAAQLEGMEIQELARVWSLPDTRLEA